MTRSVLRTRKRGSARRRKTCGRQGSCSKSPGLSGTAVFHCQQAAEKALKGFLAWHDLPFRKTHELEEIGEACLAIDPTLKAIVDRAVPLTEYAWKFRYPGELNRPAQNEAAAALATAAGVYKEIAARIPKAARP
ncbi:MAG: HEPN domain-containing protein [Candidatus Binataceae bacterium]